MKKPKLLSPVLDPNRIKPGQAAPSDLQAPGADGTNVSIPPMFGGISPSVEVTANATPKLGQGTAEPAFHGGD